MESRPATLLLVLRPRLTSRTLERATYRRKRKLCLFAALASGFCTVGAYIGVFVTTLQSRTFMQIF